MDHSNPTNLHQAVNTISPHHSFSENLAIRYGVDQSILIHHFLYWITFNRRMGKNFKDGRTWTYQSRKEIQARFPYWSYQHVRYITDKLVSMGVLMTGNYNKSVIDKTLWYAFVDEKAFGIGSDSQKMFSICENQHIDCENQQSIAKINTPIPDTITTNTKTNLKEYAPASAVAQTPEPIPKKEKKKNRMPLEQVFERVPNHPSLPEFKKYFDSPLVGLSDAQHKTLVDKYGISMVERLYEHLADWKISKGQSEPSAVTKHSDFYRIKKWVVDKELQNQKIQGTTAKNTRRPWAIAIDEVVEEKANLFYAIGTKTQEREMELLRFLSKKVGKPLQLRYLCTLKYFQMEELEKEMVKAQSLDSKES